MIPLFLYHIIFKNLFSNRNCNFLGIFKVFQDSFIWNVFKICKDHCGSSYVSWYILGNCFNLQKEYYLNSSIFKVGGESTIIESNLLIWKTEKLSSVCVKLCHNNFSLNHNQLLFCPSGYWEIFPLIEMLTFDNQML